MYRDWTVLRWKKTDSTLINGQERSPQKYHVERRRRGHREVVAEGVRPAVRAAAALRRREEGRPRRAERRVVRVPLEALTRLGGD